MRREMQDYERNYDAVKRECETYQTEQLLENNGVHRKLMTKIPIVANADRHRAKPKMCNPDDGLGFSCWTVVGKSPSFQLS